MSNDAIKLLKTQDVGYLRIVGEKVRREKDKVEHEIRLQKGFQSALGKRKPDDTEEDDEDGDDDDDDDGKPRKVVYADSQRDQRDLEQRIEHEDNQEDEEEDFPKRLQQQKKSKKQLDAERQALVESRRARKLKKRAAQSREHKFEALMKQQREIVAAQKELEWQRAKMEHSVGGTNKDGIKWKIRERKR